MNYINILFILTIFIFFIYFNKKKVKREKFTVTPLNSLNNNNAFIEIKNRLLEENINLQNNINNFEQFKTKH